jgi:ABC-type uncharacterized transport system permease subunit
MPDETLLMPKSIFRTIFPASFTDAAIILLTSLVLSLVLFGLFVLCSGVNPFEVYTLMFRGAFGTAYSWQSTLIHAAPLMLTALCVAMPARVGMVIIGGEGCVVLGGLMAALVAHALPTKAQPFVVISAMIVAGMAVGGLWTVLTGALRQLRGVNETISSLLLNYIAIAILNHMVEGPMRDPTSLDHPSSFPIGDANMLGNIPGTDIHIGLILGVVACVLCWIMMDHTTLGFASRIVGGNPRAARIAGLSITRISLLACFIGGSAAALAGVVEVAAVHGHANDSLASGLGYNGILVAFVARQNPLAIIPVSILLGGVAGSGELLQSTVGLSSASVQVFQGTLFLVILGMDTWSGRLNELGNTWVATSFVWAFRIVTRKSARDGVAHAGI